MISLLTNLLTGSWRPSYLYPDRYRPPYSTYSNRYPSPHFDSGHRAPRRHPRRYPHRRNNRCWISNPLTQRALAEVHAAEINPRDFPAADEDWQDVQAREDVSMTMSWAREEENNNNQEGNQSLNSSQIVIQRQEGRSFSWNSPGDTLGRPFRERV